jgi:hypothetical protein
MAQGFNQLVSALQRRYDYHSARAVALDSLEAAGLEKRASYEDKEWAKLLKATHETGDDLDSVWTALGSAPKGVKLRAPAATDEKPVAVKSDAPQESAPAEAAAPKKAASSKKGGAKKAASKRKG